MKLGVSIVKRTINNMWRQTTHYMISTYRPNKKYKIVEFTNGLGEKWYNIQTIGYLWNSWFKIYYETDYGMCGFIPDFVSETEAIDYLKIEKIKYLIIFQYMNKYN